MRSQSTSSQRTKRLAIVPRVSTQDQEEYGTSLDDQKSKGLLLGQLHDYSVDDRPYSEGGHIYSGDESGALPLAQRPIMRRLIADAKAHKFDAVCFTKIDRIARRLKYILEIWDALDGAGVTVLVIDPAIDTSTPIGRLIRNVLGSIAEFERDSILERTMGGRRRKLARQENFLPAGKYGYTYTRIDRVTHTPGRVTINEQHAEIVRRIYQRRVQRVSFERIAAELTAHDVPAPAGGVRWQKTTIQRIVTDTAYKGRKKWGVGMQVRTEHGKRVWRRRQTDQGVIDVDYPAIVEPALWQAAQDANGAGTACVQRATVDRFLLRGAMVRCTDHDHAMTGATGGNSKTQYRCIRQLPTGKRATHCVPARDLDEAVWAEIRAFLLAPGRGIAAARALTADAERELEHVARQRAGNAARRAELDRQAAYLARCARETAIAPKVLEGQLREIDAEQERLCAADVRLAAREEVARDVLPQAAEIEAICRELAAGAAHATPTERRAILDALDVTVAMDGFDYTISGVVPSLRCQGTLWVHAERSC